MKRYVFLFLVLSASVLHAKGPSFFSPPPDNTPGIYQIPGLCSEKNIVRQWKEHFYVVFSREGLDCRFNLVDMQNMSVISCMMPYMGVPIPLDMKIIKDTVYFCGDAAENTNGFIGFFEINDLFYNGGVFHFYCDMHDYFWSLLNIPHFSRVQCMRLIQMDVVEDESNGVLIYATGVGLRYNYVNSVLDSCYYLVELKRNYSFAADTAPGWTYTAISDTTLFGSHSDVAVRSGKVVTAWQNEQDSTFLFAKSDFPLGSTVNSSLIYNKPVNLKSDPGRNLLLSSQESSPYCGYTTYDSRNDSWIYGIVDCFSSGDEISGLSFYMFLPTNEGAWGDIVDFDYNIDNQSFYCTHSGSFSLNGGGNVNNIIYRIDNTSCVCYYNENVNTLSSSDHGVVHVMSSGNTMDGMNTTISFDNFEQTGCYEYESQGMGLTPDELTSVNAHIVQFSQHPLVLNYAPEFVETFIIEGYCVPEESNRTKTIK